MVCRWLSRSQSAWVVALWLSGVVIGLHPASAQESEQELRARLEQQAAEHRPSFPELLPFDPTKWLTTTEFTPIGDPAAKKGGMLLQVWTSYPPNLRTDGPDSNLVQTADLHALIYESLISTHPDTLEPIPSLASHWQREEVLGEDGKVAGEIYRFRIDERARWADGSEVTADDVVWSWRHRIDPERKDPSNVIVFSEFNEPRALDKYTVEVATKKVNWRLFLYFGGMAIYPAKYVKAAGDDYLKGYQWQLMLGSGPYHLASPADMVAQESFTLTRRADWWARDLPANVGLNNFDKLKWIVVLDNDTQFNKMKAGELDYFVVGKAQRWAEECDFEQVQMGWILKRKIYTQQPQSYQGFCFNMRQPPFDDLRVRKAFAHLFNREKLIETLFYQQYEMIDSYWPGGEWANPSNPQIRYDPQLASQLLAAAGWKDRNADGWLVDASGKIFEVTLEYGAEAYTRIFTVIKEDMARAGIKLELQLLDWRVVYSKVNERKFTLAFNAYRGILYPNPRTSWHSSLADQPNNNNVPGFKNERVDRLLETYDNLLGVDKKTWEKRRAVIRMIDKIVFEEHPYALGWYASFTRVLYKNKFGHPATYFSRIGDASSIASMWWYDADKDAALQAAQREGRKLVPGEVVQRPFELVPDK